MNAHRARVRWFYLALATAAQAAASMIRLGVPALMPLIRDEFALDPAQVGLVSSVLNGGAAAAGIPGGRLVDRVGERLVIGYTTVASGLIVLTLHAATGFGPLLVVLLATGFATTMAVPAGGVLVGRWFVRSERGLAMGLRQTGVPLGGALAAVLLPPLALATDWRVALDVAALLAILVGLAALWLYREAPRAAGPPATRPPSGVGALARADIGGLMGYAFAFGGAQWCFLAYIVLYLTERLALPLLVAGALLGAAQVCGAVGRIVWGVASDRAFGGRRSPVLLLIGLTAMLATVGLALVSAEAPLWAVAGLVALLGFTLLGWNALPHALAPELAGPHAAGLAVGLINSSGFLGVIVFPPVFGVLVEATASYTVAWLGLIVVLGGGLAALPLLYRAEAAAQRAAAD